MRIGQRAYQAFYRGDRYAAEDLYLEAYNVYPNKSVLQGLCAVKMNIGAELHDDRRYQDALRYLLGVQSLCPDDAWNNQSITKIRLQIEVDAQVARARLQQRVSADRVNAILSEFETFLSKSFPSHCCLPVAGPATSTFSGEGRRLAYDPASSQGLRIKSVPLPPEVLDYYRRNDPFGGTAYGGTRTIDLILDALEEGDGSLERSVLSLIDRLYREGQNRHGVVALSYLEGLYLGGIGADEETLVIAELFSLALDATDSPGAYWLGLLSPEYKDWRKQRNTLVFEALSQTDGLEASLQYIWETQRLAAYRQNPSTELPLLSSSEKDAGWSAYYYIAGLIALPQFRGGNGR